MKTDVYETITQLEQGVRPWMCPWSGAQQGSISRPVRHNGLAYNGINILMLWLSSMEKGFSAPMWMTYRQAAELGGHVRKGEKGTQVVYADAILRSETNEQGEEEQQRIPFLKAYTVFNIEQIEGLPDRYSPVAVEPVNPDARDAWAEAFFAGLGADIRHGGSRAFYHPAEDFIQMPDFGRFRDAESYYATLAHEATHWTMHESRLARTMSAARFGDAAYAMEELVAELGAAFLCADLGLEPELREDHASYIGSWLKALKDDKRAIFTAAAKASEAASWLTDNSARCAVEVD